LHLTISFFFHRHGDHRDLHSFPTRRSSDLASAPTAPTKTPKTPEPAKKAEKPTVEPAEKPKPRPKVDFEITKPDDIRVDDNGQIDRKSTRLNSSHVKISYAVFCLKKKKKQH